jgi:hypothetical protein
MQLLSYPLFSSTIFNQFNHFQALVGFPSILEEYSLAILKMYLIFLFIFLQPFDQSIQYQGFPSILEEF